MLRWVLVALAVGTVGLAGSVLFYLHAEKNRVEALAAQQISDCPRDQIRLISSVSGDTMEQYELEACGRSVTMLCMAPDFVCMVHPSR